MVEPVSITSLALTTIAVISYLTKKGIKRFNSKGIQSNCGIELTDVIENTKIEIVNELKSFMREEINELLSREAMNEKIVVERFLLLKYLKSVREKLRIQ